MGLIPRSIWDRVYYGWWIVLLGSLVITVGGGILIHGFSVFFLPLKRDLAVSSAAVSLLYGAARLEGGVEGPLVGYLIDRWGPRKLMFIGIVLAGAGFLLLSLVQTFWQFFFVYIFIISVGFNAGFFHPVYAAINSWFVRHRGKGFAITGAAVSVGGMFMAPLLSYFIVTFGWRTAAVFAGLIILAVCLPSTLPIRRSPETLGLLPDGGLPPANGAEGKSRPGGIDAQVEYTVRQALRRTDYWLLFTAISLRVAVTVALQIHLVPIFVWKGLTEVAGAYMVSLFALGTILTTLVFGWVGDRWNKSLLSGLGIFPTIAGMMLLMGGEGGIFLYALPLGLAVTMGTVPLNWAAIGDLFGRHTYGTLRGIMGVGNGLATFLTPIYAGWVFDRTGGYSLALWTFLFIHLAGSVLFWVLYRRSTR